MLNRPTYRINPIDTGQKRGIGISVLFNNDNNIFNTTTTTNGLTATNTTTGLTATTTCNR